MKFTFLMCSERSGSNLITRMMDNHSLYCGPSPVHLLRILLEHSLHYGDLSNPVNWEILLNDARALFESKTGVWRSDWPQKFSVQHTVADLVKVLYLNESLANGKTRVFVKENHVYRYLSYIRAHFSSAKLVLLVRDPRDMALSWKRSPVLRGSVIRASTVWHADQNACLKLYSWFRDKNEIFLLKYEELVSESEYHLRRLCAFLDINFEKSMLGFQKNFMTVANAGRSMDWGNLNKPIIKDNFKKYRRGLLPEEIEFVEAVCQQEMDLLGYEREFSRPGSPDELQKIIGRFERYEKTEYQDLTVQERLIRARRSRAVNQIKARQVIPFLPAKATRQNKKYNAYR